MIDLTRRSFLRGTTAAVAGVAVVPLAAKAVAPEQYSVVPDSAWQYADWARECQIDIYDSDFGAVELEYKVYRRARELKRDRYDP